jgi:hypothetical protein
VKILDGVTTALEMETGAPDVTAFLNAKENRSLIHYGATASHLAARAAAFGAPLSEGQILPNAGPATDRPASPEQLAAIRTRLNQQLDAGALGVGFGSYARARRVGNHPDVRWPRSHAGVHPRAQLRSNRAGIQRGSGGRGHRRGGCDRRLAAHAHQQQLREGQPECLDMIAGARSWPDVTTEGPHTAGMTSITSALLTPMEVISSAWTTAVWLPDTGEHLISALRGTAQFQSGARCCCVITEATSLVITQPRTMIASDGGIGHPRNAGTFEGSGALPAPGPRP